MTTMVSPSQQDYRTLATTAADERQLRISAFRNKVATLRATSKVYNITNTGDRSINTLDSSVATVATARGAKSSPRGGGGAKEASRDDAASTLVAASVPVTERTPETEKSNPFADDEEGASNRGGEGTAGDGAGGGVPVAYEKSTNPFFEGDSENSSDEETITVDSSVLGDSNHSQEEEDLFASMAKAFRKVQTSKTAGTSKKEDREEPSSKTIEPTNLDEKIDTTGRAWGATAWSKRGGTNSYISRQTSSSVKSSAASGTSSANTSSTSGGFSIGSIAEESNNDGSRSSVGIVNQSKDNSSIGNSKGIVSKDNISNYDIQQVESESPKGTLDNPFAEEDVESVTPKRIGYDGTNQTPSILLLKPTASSLGHRVQKVGHSQVLVSSSDAVSKPNKGTSNVTKVDVPLVKSSSPVTEKKPHQPPYKGWNNPFMDEDDSNAISKHAIQQLKSESPAAKTQPSSQPFKGKSKDPFEEDVESASPTVSKPYKGKPDISKNDMPWTKSLSPATNKESFQPCKSNSYNPFEDEDDDNSNNPFEDDDDAIIQDVASWSKAAAASSMENMPTEAKSTEQRQTFNFKSNTPFADLYSGSNKGVVSKDDTIQHAQSTVPPSTKSASMEKEQAISSSKWTSRVVSNDAIQQQESASTTDIHPAESSVTSTIASSSTAEQPSQPMEESRHAPNKRSKNPFADLLALRQANKKATNRRLAESVGSMNFESSSSEETSMSSHSEQQSQSTTGTGSRNKKKVFFHDDYEDSLDGVLFSDLKKALSKIQSVDYEEETLEEGKGEEEWADEQEEVEDVSRLADIKSQVVMKMEESPSGVVVGSWEDIANCPADMKSQIIVKEESPSCAISSLKDTFIFDDDSDFNDDPFEDDDDDVMSVAPKSPAPLESNDGQFEDDDDDIMSVTNGPAPLESNVDQFEDDDDAVTSVPKRPSVESRAQEVHMLGQEVSDTSNEDSTFRASVAEAIARANDTAKEAEGGNSSVADSITVTCSNSHKVDYLKERSRENSLTPPKKGVLISDGSISTKTDSILGKTINVANADLVAERIYLESLRAQVLAELKVHVADEEIRLALDARLQAIQDYYKRKATVMHLKPAAAAMMTTSPPGGHHHSKDNFLKGLGDLPQVKPTVIHSTRVEEAAAAAQPSNVIPYPQQRQDSHKFAFERVQGQMDEAIKAAHNSLKQSVVASAEEEEKVAEEEEEEEEKEALYNRQATETPIPLHIFTKDTFWDDEDDPSTIHVIAPSSPPTPGGIVEKPIPPTHEDTVQNAWHFYRNVNALIFDSRVYDYEFQLIEEDPLYPYLNSLVGIADGGMDGYANEHKRISQNIKKEYTDKSPHRICHSLAQDATEALGGLKEICAYIGSKLGMQTMAVGPIKKPSEALLKCEKKYGGNPLLVTDYCRASLFVKDVASLLALIEIVLSKYANIVKRIKLSNMKCDHVPLVGGYRDCKINLDIGGHICEIQIHLVSMWLIKEGKGYSYYKECCDHKVDISSFDISRTLAGLKRGVLADLVKVGEDATRRTPIIMVQQYNEKQIRDYFALANMYLHYGLPAKAEYILRRIVKLRSESNDFGPCHAETLLQMELLRKSLRCQHKYKSASSINNQIKKAKNMLPRGRDAEQLSLSELCTTDSCGAIDYVCDMILDPSKKERQEEKRKADTVEESRALWLKERRSFFS